MTDIASANVANTTDLDEFDFDAALAAIFGPLEALGLQEPQSEAATYVRGTTEELVERGADFGFDLVAEYEAKGLDTYAASSAAVAELADMAFTLANASATVGAIAGQSGIDAEAREARKSR